MPVFLVPAFLLFGETLFAATASAQLSIFVLLLLSIFCCMKFVFRLDIHSSIAAASGLIVILVFVEFVSDANVLSPGNSLKPLRNIAPILSLPTVSYLSRRLIRTNGMGPTAFHMVIGGIFTAVSALWANDTGIPTAAAIVLVLSIAAYRTKKITHATCALLALITSALVTMMILISLLSVDIGSWLTYTFRDVPTYQFWFFGPWEPETRVLRAIDIIRIPTQSPVSLLCYFICAISLVYHLKHAFSGLAGVYIARHLAISAMILSALGASALLQIGGRIQVDYMSVLIVPVFLVLFNTMMIWCRASSRLKLLLKSIRVNGVLIGGAITSFTCAIAVSALVLSKLGLHSVFVPDVGAWVSSERIVLEEASRLRSLAAFRDLPPGERIFSDYYSAVNLVADAQHASRFPTVIHALGDRSRAQYLKDFAQTKFPFVTTISPKHSGYANWNVRASWYLYKEILGRYRPYRQTEQHIFWTPDRPTQQPVGDVSCLVRTSQDAAAQVEVSWNDSGRSGVWLADVTLQLFSYPRRTAFRELWAISELDTPLSRDESRSSERWEGWPRYGIPRQLEHNFPIEVVDSVPSRVLLHVESGSVSARDLRGRCQAVVRYRGEHGEVAVLRPYDLVKRMQASLPVTD